MNFRQLWPFSQEKEENEDGEDDTCLHEEYPVSEENRIWYLEETGYTEDHWVEKDAAYVRIRGTKKSFVCLGCGERKVIESSVRVGGKKGIKLKRNMDDVELKRFKADVHTGSFFNDWPEDHYMNNG